MMTISVIMTISVTVMLFILQEVVVVVVIHLMAMMIKTTGTTIMRM